MGPAVDCHPLPTFNSSELASVQKAFAGATAIHLGQSWLVKPDTGFAPAIVRTGWRHDALLVFAELSDVDIFTRAARHNDRFWELGDTFEMFLQPPGGTSYVELHVTPNNLRLQLRFPKPLATGDPDPFAAGSLPTPAFDSHTWVAQQHQKWFVFAQIAAASAGYTTGPLAPSTWRFSFSRYDATRDRQAPVISSSSPHIVPAFHRPHEWGTLHFVD